MLIECSNIKKSFQGIDLLTDISFKVDDHDKIAIIGVNGAGKTTILNILIGEESYDSGDLFKSRDLNIGYLKQHHDLDMNKTIYECALEVFDPLIQIENRMRELESMMSYDHSEQVMNEYDSLTQRFNEKDGFSYPSRIVGVLKGMGFVEEDFQKYVHELSGGQKTRLCLAKLLLEEPKLLVLDEPTNHLDSQAISFLENYLKGYKNALIVVSHDRYFIDVVSNKIIEIENGKSHSYNCRYEEYSIQKRTQRAIDLKHYINQQKEIKKIQESIDTLKSFNREKSIKRAESKEKQLAKIERIDRPENLPSAITVQFTPAIESGYDVLKVNDLSMRYDQIVFEHCNLDIKKGERVAIVGENGVGKTTTIGKLANYFHLFKYKVMLAAGDTFRAAAAEQLQIWGERAGCEVIRHEEGADPAAVVFDAVKAAIARNVDVLFIDTAGRLHNKTNLMNELEKVHRIIKREIPEAPHETFLVLDATTGQNAINQAKVFMETANVTGVVLTKLDGTAKGGVVIAIKEELGLPVKWIGVGEGIMDFRPFEADKFVDALFDGDK